MRKQPSTKHDLVFVVVALVLAIAGNFAVSEIDRRLDRFQDEPEQSAVVELEEAPAAEPGPETAPLYDVPLDADLQRFIIQAAEANDIDPAVILAMIARESDFHADAIGDNGESFGLMQIMEYQHLDRLDRLGITNLLDPYQNVLVGIDYLSELLDRGNGLEWALRAYNTGPSGANRGYGSDYAAEVLKKSETIKEGMIIHEY